MRLASAIVAGLISGLCSAQECGSALAGHRRVAGNEHYVVAFATSPHPIVVGEHFAIDFVVCPRANGTAPQSVRVDASMPEHRHGMNYRPGVTTIRPGTYRAEGLLFHMRGRWQVTFDLTSGGSTEQLATSIVLE